MMPYSFTKILLPDNYSNSFKIRKLLQNIVLFCLFDSTSLIGVSISQTLCIIPYLPCTSRILVQGLKWLIYKWLKWLNSKKIMYKSSSELLYFFNSIYIYIYIYEE